MVKYLFEILVPTEKPSIIKGKNRYFTTRYHRGWDQRVLAIAGGLTVLHPGTGLWMNRSGKLYRERMIPVRIMCEPHQMIEIVKMTGDYYKQEAIMYYQVSSAVEVVNFPENVPANNPT